MKESYLPKAAKNRPLVFLTAAAGAGLLAACGETPRQYQYETPSLAYSDGSGGRPAAISHSHSPITAFLMDEATRPNGGLPLWEKPVQTEAEKDERTRQNSLAPINYQERSAGNISMETDYEESLGILNFDFTTSSGISIYKEGLAVAWRDDPPRSPEIIFILSSYQGALDFGPSMGEKRSARVGQSFADQFSLGAQNILEDPKARRFITSIYRHLEGADEDCLEAQTCSLSINPEANYILFLLPKMTLLFGNNDRRKLTQIAMKLDNDSGCFKSPFDLATGQFRCEAEDGSKTPFSLGASYKETLKKSGISRDLPIIYRNTYFYQRTRAAIVFWKRSNFEEKERAIPDDSHLSGVLMRDHEYNIPFLINESLVKISLAGQDGVSLSLDPLTEQEEGEWSMEDIKKKVEAQKADPSVFYLATEMPQIRDNYPLQINLISALLDLLEESHIKRSSAPDSIQISKRVFGRHKDAFALEASGLMTVQKTDKEGPLLKFEISIDESSGRGAFFLGLVDDDFERRAWANQGAELDFSGPVREILGFELGGRIYLRDKKPGPETAIAAYLTEDGQTLVTLAKYTDEAESAAVYPSGRDKNIIFEKSEKILAGGLSFYMRPTGQAKDIGGHSFDEYEISKISSNSRRIFAPIRSLCGIEGFDVDMGLRDREFAEKLALEIKQAREDSRESSAEKPFEGCFYMAPADPLFTGVKREFFFPKHNLILGFADRELSGLAVYKKPSESLSESQEASQ